MKVRGIRGAIRVKDNSQESIFTATKELLLTMVQKNEVELEEIASIFLTATPDLNAEFPAYAARDLGWTMVPLLCAQEIGVPGSMTRLIRILIHFNTTKGQNEISHQYLGEAGQLRPDLAGNNE
jgi:chorismate mutase